MATTSATQPTSITKNLSLRIDGQEVTVRDGTTILEAAAQLGITIPVLCHDDRYDPVGVCRMCVVDVGARAYAAACVRPCEEGMEVTTTGETLDRSPQFGHCGTDEPMVRTATRDPIRARHSRRDR